MKESKTHFIESNSIYEDINKKNKIIKAIGRFILWLIAILLFYFIIIYPFGE